MGVRARRKCHRDGVGGVRGERGLFTGIYFGGPVGARKRRLYTPSLTNVADLAVAGQPSRGCDTRYRCESSAFPRGTHENASSALGCSSASIIIFQHLSQYYYLNVCDVLIKILINYQYLIFFYVKLNLIMK